MWNRQKSGLVLVLFLAAWLLGLVPCNAQPPESAKLNEEPESHWDRLHSHPPLTRLTAALRDFDDKEGHLPHRALRSRAGKPLLSWRVAVLPFMGQGELHQQFHLDEPRDSDHNRKLIPRMPNIFAVDIDGVSIPDASAGRTRIVLPIIGGSLWHGDDSRPPRIKDVTDGTAYTMGLLVAPPGADVVWTRPEDFPMKKPHEMFGDRTNCLVVTLDGALWRISKSASDTDLNGLLTFSSGDAFEWKRPLARK